MASGPSYLDRKGSSVARPAAASPAAAPPSPHTPQRPISSTYSSPGGFRTEDEAVVFEFGSRHIRVGFAGQSSPICVMKFGPEQARRVGDYRRWLPGYDERPRFSKKVDDWGVENELWRMDLRNLDVGLVEDKIERAVRKAYGDYLLIDAKSRRAIVVVPALLPHALLSAVLSVLFANFQIPSVTMLPPASMAAFAAGQRSALVVDVGWHETVLTAVYDLREISQRRTTRAMRMATLSMGRLLEEARLSQLPEADREAREEGRLKVDFEHAEEVLVRMGWCRPSSREELLDLLKTLRLNEQEEGLSEQGPTGMEETQRGEDDPIKTIPSGLQTEDLRIPFSALSEPAESTFFPTEARSSPHLHDDHEQPLHSLLYLALLSLPPDVRSLCMSRIIITGGGSRIPGLMPRLIEELSELVQQRGWDAVWGKAADAYRERRKLQEIDSNRVARGSSPPPRAEAKSSEDTENLKEVKPTAPAAAFREQEADPILERLNADEPGEHGSTVSGELRCLESMGVWAGASLTGTLRIKGVVEIERETFLQHGLQGARKEHEVKNIKARQSYGGSLGRAIGPEGGAWTLGLWA